MAAGLTLETLMRDAIANEVDNHINTTGAGTAKIEFRTSGDAEVATVDLQNPAFGASSTGVITLQGVTLSDTNATGGTMAKCAIFNRTPAIVITGTVGTSGEDINFAGGVVVNAGDTVELTAYTITCPAS